MKKTLTTKQIKSNLVLSIASQCISLLVSLIMNLILPKFIPELDYALWQTYILYVGYAGVLHLGLLDGIVLRYSQYDYDELDKPRIRSQLHLMLLINILMTLIVIVMASIMGSGNMKWIFILVGVGIITKNAYTFTSYSFQITNQISKYVMVSISMRLFYGIGTILLLLLKVKCFYLFCIADLVSDLFGVAIGYVNNKELYYGKSLSFKESIKEFKTNVSSGILLLIANWSSMLLVGSAKMIIQWHWDELTFGKVSFSFSVSSLFLTFVNAISVVLFPSLKRLEQDKLPKMYMNIRNMVSPILFFTLLLFFPGCWILELWLPKYHMSLIHLGVLLPIIIYTSKVSLLTNNYLKAYRKEKSMLIINVISVAVAFISFIICAYVFNSLTALLVSTVIVIMMRSILSEIKVSKIIHINLYKHYLIEAIMTLVFILCAKLLSLIMGFCVYLVLFIIYLFIYRDSILQQLRRKK